MKFSLFTFGGILLSASSILTSCGPEPKAADTQPASANEKAPAVAPDAASKKASNAASTTAPARAEPTDVPPKGPATPAEAAKTLDLNKAETVEGVDKDTLQRTIANLSYKARSTVKDAFEFHRKQLLAQRWKELPNSYVTDQSASAVFARNTFHVSLSVIPDSTPGMVNVMLHNHGNVNLSKLPRPSTQKTVYEGETAAMYVSDAPVPATATECQRLMKQDGWEVYGSAGDTTNYKQNGVMVGVTVSAAPAEGGKTMISFSKDMMSYDIPSFPDAASVQYVDNLRRLSFDTNTEAEAVAGFYKERLAKTGWKANEEKLLSDEDKDFMVFREPSGGLLFLNIGKGYQGKRKVELEGTTMEEFNAASARARKKAVAEVERRKEAAKMAKIALKLPSGAEGLKSAKDRVEFTLPSGRAQATAEAWSKQYKEEGWKEDVANLAKAFGSMALSKDGMNLSINYTDTGIMPAEFTIYTIGAELETR